MADQFVLEFEEWRDIDGYPYYQVSSLGRIRSFITPRHTRRMVPKILKATPANTGYPRATLIVSIGAPKKYESVHVLICTAFHGPKPTPFHEVAHWDGNRQNCRADNLRWATNAENHDDRIRMGRARRKLDEQKVREIRQLIADGLGNKIIAERYGIHPTMVYNIKVGRKAWNWLK